MAEFSIKTTQIRETSDHFQDIRAEMDRIKSECSDVKKNLGLGFSLGSPYRLRLMAVNASLAQETTRMRRMQDGLYDIAERYELADNRNCDIDRDIVGIGAGANADVDFDTLAENAKNFIDKLKGFLGANGEENLTPEEEIALENWIITTELFGYTFSVDTGITIPTREEHYNRNQNMTVDIPPDLNSVLADPNWIEMEPADSACHQNTATGGPNRKFVTRDGINEAVYDFDGNLVTATEDIGTYNFADPNSDKWGHAHLDLLPWYLYGNGPDDSTTMEQRIKISVEGFVDGKIDAVEGFVDRKIDEGKELIDEGFEWVGERAGEGLEYINEVGSQSIDMLNEGIDMLKGL